MTKLFLLAAFLLVQSVHAETTDRLYLISQKNMNLSKSRVTSKIVDTTNEHSLVYLKSEEVSKLSRLLHEESNICGGYIDVTEEFVQSKKDVKSFLQDQANIPIASFDKSEPTFPKQVTSAITKFDKGRYWEFLKQLSSFPDRSALTQDGVKAAKWLGDHALKVATENGRTDVSVRYFETGGRYIQPSTLVKLAGRNPALPAVLVGGHMDTFEIKPGADDDGTGTTTVMEVFHSLVKSGLKFERDMYFAFYAAEERGLVGSGVMARTMTQEGTKFRGALQFDMTGFKSPRDQQKIYFINDNVDPVMTMFLKKLAVNYLGLTMAELGDDKCGYACSDHAQWQRLGVPAAFPFESSFANYNRTIHTANDKIELLNVDHSSQFAKLGIAFMVEAAEPVQ